ncbi:MAG: S-methyl-5-thioribose-1-phosphate isomerase [Ignavibacteria bacterium]|nr:S-methyl-5-thioribose-1-phosphate isomerase [Ignavibacteria bacterium]
MPDVLRWTGDALRFLDQTLLPGETRMLETRDYRAVIDALKRLAIRGAPLIGIAGAYAAVLAARALRECAPAAFREQASLALAEISAARPTAVNLAWAMGQCQALVSTTDDPANCTLQLENLAAALHADDARRCESIGQYGAIIIPEGAGVVTHCNAGALATGGEGTAIAVILAAHRQGKGIHVFVDETRPLLQGARLTMWELLRHEVPATLITDGMAASLMREGRIQVAITGADRIAANGDTANKIGTYALAVAAKYHRVPFYIAAPLSTLDLALPDGNAIPIEHRDESEVTSLQGIRTAPEGARACNPAFDITPGELITGIVTERGIIAPPWDETLAAIVS